MASSSDLRRHRAMTTPLQSRVRLPFAAGRGLAECSTSTTETPRKRIATSFRTVRVTARASKLHFDAVEREKEETRAMFEREEQDREHRIRESSAEARADLARLSTRLPSAREQVLAHLRSLSRKERVEMLRECRPDPLGCPYPPALIVAAGASPRERLALAGTLRPWRSFKGRPRDLLELRQRARPDR